MMFYVPFFSFKIPGLKRSGFQLFSSIKKKKLKKIYSTSFSL